MKHLAYALGLCLLPALLHGQATEAPAANPPALMTEAETKLMLRVMDSTLMAYQKGVTTKRRAAQPLPSKYGYQPGEVPQFTADVYAKRLKELCTVVPMDYNPIVQRFIEAYTIRHRELVGQMLGMQHVYFPIIEEIFDREGVPLELKYLSCIESAFNTRARSRVAAVGLWQFMIYTGKDYGLRVDSYVDERQDPYKSTLAAARYLKDLYKVYNDWHLVIAAYNCGPGWVNRGIRLSGKANFWAIWQYLPYETRAYVPSYIACTYAMNYPAEHNISPLWSDFSFQQDSVRVQRRELSLDYVAKVTGADVALLYELNPELRLGRVPYSERSYTVRVPKAVADFALQYPDSIYAKAPIKDEVAYANSPAANPYAAPAGWRTVYHTVRQGQTMGHIAQTYGTSVSNLMGWNNKFSAFINVGEVLKVYLPPAARTAAVNNSPAPTTYKGPTKNYTVQSGDSLWTIAQKHKGVTMEQLMVLNGLTASSTLAPGQVIKVPVI